eukprot:TRINITY_DN56709_c0_g1_i1.p1 TRINITY_DN56709_c0_g1~~TRINITY_DN56709_c0_g1_i1.p1  ORF type:complete len:286 (-),score=22.48 TRINITY_DN56709_c0_g1_i1:84-821(-)
MSKLTAQGANTVVLNVGGKRFTTTRSTLLSETDSFFYGMISSGVWKPDPHTGEYFINRNPQFFHEILEYLRRGKSDGDLTGVLDVDSLSHKGKALFLEHLEFLQIGSLLPSFRGQATKRVKFVAFAKWNFNAIKQTDAKQDALMNTAAFEVGGSRAATMSEFTQCLIDKLPSTLNQPRKYHGSPKHVLFTGEEETFGQPDESCKSGHYRLGVELPVPVDASQTKFVHLIGGKPGGASQYYCIAVK